MRDDGEYDMTRDEFIVMINGRGMQVVHSDDAGVDDIRVIGNGYIAGKVYKTYAVNEDGEIIAKFK